MKAKYFSAAFFLFLCPALYAIDWPSSTGVMTRNFGWNDSGEPHLGVSFSGSGEVAAAQSGELLYEHWNSGGASRLPSPLGAWVALDHGDGLISMYSRMDKNSPVQLSDSIEEGAVVGHAGISGWASQNGFFFQFFDRAERQWVNPAMIIRSMPSRTPFISQVRLMDTQGRVFNLPQTTSLSQGRYTVLVNAGAGQPATALAPFRIICVLNGSEAGALNFETFFVRDGSLVVYRNGLIPVKRVHAPAPGFEVADLWLTRGRATLDIIVQDISGVTRNALFRFAVE